MVRGCGMFYLPDFCAKAHSEDNTGKDIVVIHKSRVYALSSEMTGSGINRGFGISRVTSINPKCIIVDRNQTLEQAYYRSVLKDLYQTTPQILANDVGTPELWVEINRFDKWKLRRCLKKYLAKVGYARTRNLSKLAAFTAKCTELLVVRPESEGVFLKKFKTRDLRHLGFDLECLEMLDLLGFRDLFSLSKLTLRQLTSRFGEEGHRLFEFLTDETTTGFIPNWNPNSITIENTVEWDYSESDYKNQITEAIELALKQKRKGIFSFQIRFGEGSKRIGMKTFDHPTKNVNKVATLAVYILKKLLQSEEKLSKYKIDFDLRELDNVQSDLWGRSDWELLTRTLNKRFPQKCFLPAPIASAFVPEDVNVLRPLDDR